MHNLISNCRKRNGFSLLLTLLVFINELFQTVSDMRPDADDDRMRLEDLEDIPSMSITERDRESPAFITVENEKGVIEHVQVRACCHVHKSSSVLLPHKVHFVKYKDVCHIHFFKPYLL